MSDRKEPMYPSNNKGKNWSDEEIEETLTDEQEEKSTLSKILENKKLTVPILIILIVLGVIYLFTPSKEKEEVPNKKEKVQTAENINLDSLESKKTDEELQNPNYQNNGNSQEFFSYDDSNLQTYNASENNPNLDIPKNTQSNYTYGNYPSYYGKDELPDDNYSIESTKGQQSEKSSSEKPKNSSISFDRGNNQTTTGQEVEQAGGQQQAPNNQKKTFQLSSGLTAPKSPYEIKTGELIPAVLMSGIDSDLAGNITAIVSQDVYDSIRGRHLLIPKGSKLYGTYDSNILYGQNRLMLIWQRIILPNGYSINLESMQGLDITGQAGVSGKVNNHTLKLLRSIVLSSIFNFVSSGVSVSAGKNVSKNGSTDVSATATLGNNVANDTSSKLQNAGDMIIERDLNQQPTIRVKAGTRFSIMVNNDMVLVPYNKLKGIK